ncbi:tRNA (guanosine(18)-2'-O)-methyltransferase TARBP1 isoform X2 [Lasioglossum baleicum]|uniref:tRNA (guanosine(18)-2'-O)-methyltransferase TARBP1 isoform X2 n=1 Tax=Lasioglossum baleicum TaxID=434251 RepID=UPI003FCE216B
MDSHERYMHFPTPELSLLESCDTAFKTEPFKVLHRLIENYATQIANNISDTKKLETFRAILCYEYQLLFHPEKKYTRTESHNLCFKQIENVLDLNKYQLQNPSDRSILYDIITLYTLLFCNLRCLEEHVSDFRRTCLFYVVSGNESERVYYMKILECFLDSIELGQLLNVHTRTQLSQVEFQLYFYPAVTLWLEISNNKEWSTFASIFQKLMNAFDDSRTFFVTVLCSILIDMKDFQDQLSTLSIIVDTCYSGKIKDANWIYDVLCYNRDLWLIIIKSLKSSVRQYRKQGLFLMKRLTNFSSTSDKCIIKSRKTRFAPFMCAQSVQTEIPITDIREKFYIVLEALEEKQYHLVAPALTHVPNLIKGSEEHTSCNDCFGMIWLQLIFERILRHENNAIIKQGISHVCQFHKVLHDSEFLKLFLNVLNETFLYECQSYEKEPEIVDEITTLFVLRKNTEVEFISRLLEAIANETWAPIPLFYMTLILRMVTDRTSNVWKENDLIIIKSFIQTHLHAHSCIFRVASQIELIRTISLSLERVDNLKILANTLMEFPSDEALVRGSFSWNSITTCLKAKVTEIETTNFVKTLCEDDSHQDTHVRMDPAKFASVIFLFYDAELILCTKSCSTEQILYKWLSSLNSCDVRPYANVEHILYTIEVLSELLNLSRNEDKRMIQLLSGHTRNALKFLLKHSKSTPSKFDYEQANRFMITITSFLNRGNLILPKSELFDYVGKFKYDSIIILKNIEQFTNMNYMCALHILHYTQSILDPKSIELYVQPLLNMHHAPISDNNERHKDSKGKVASQCYLLLAKLMNQYLSNVEIELWPENIDWQYISHIYEMGGNEIIPEVALTLKNIVDKGGMNIDSSESMSNFESVFTVCWRSALLSSKNKLYFLAIKALLEVIVNRKFLILPNAISLVNRFLEELLEESNKVPKLKTILLNEMKLLDTRSLRNLQQPLLLCLLHGHALRKDKQIENQTCSYIAKNFKTFYPQHMPVADHNNDGSIRALSVILLHKTITADVEFATAFFPIVLQKLGEYKNKRYFNHSYTHRIKHRIMQILLVLQPILNEADTTTLVDLLCDSMLLESNQHSVRIMQEWLLIKIFLENKHRKLFVQKLWTFFGEGIVKRPGCVSSIACIFYHVAKLLSGDVQTIFITLGMPYVARCCLGQQYNMRLYNQAIFMQLFQLLKNSEHDNFTNEYRGLYNAIVNSLNDENTMKSFIKIQEDFYLSTFHALNDYNLQVD